MHYDASGKLIGHMGGRLVRVPARHPRGRRGQRLGHRPVADRRPRRGRQRGATSDEAQSERQDPAAARHAASGRQGPERVQLAVRRRRRQERRHLRGRRTRRGHERTHDEVRQERQVSSRNGASRATAPAERASSRACTRSPSIRGGAYSSAIATTTAFRSTIRTESISIAGTSSAARAASSSTPTTTCS